MIDVVNVHKSYRSGSRLVEALRGVSCRIDRGRFAFIVGPSGSGKSTLLYLIGAIDRPSSGEIIVDGQDLVTMSEMSQNLYRRDQIGFIFQSFNLISNLTALENVLVPFMPRGVDCRAEAAGRRLADGSRPGGSVGPPAVPTFRRRAATRGDRPRVVKQPIVVLADEPTGELDSKTGDEIYTSFAAFRKRFTRHWSSSPTTGGLSLRMTWSWKSRTVNSPTATATVVSP